jgi:hypothetical protein
LMTPVGEIRLGDFFARMEPHLDLACKRVG